MKKFYTTIMALLASISLQAQVPVQAYPNGASGHETMTQMMRNGGYANPNSNRTSKGSESTIQNPKWLTNLPVDSAIYRQEFIPYKEGSTAFFSTVYYKDLTHFFVGNRIKTIRTLIPEFAKDITVWIKDVGEGSEKLLWETTLPDSVKTNEIIDVPCDLLIEKAYKMQVGFTFTVTKTNPVFPAVVPCNRTESWIQGETGTNNGQPYDYTTMRNIVYGDPHPFYGCYFHCITEGDAGLPDYDLRLNGVSHNRVPLGTDTECDIFYQSYGAKAIDNLSFESSTSLESNEIEIGEAISYLGYGQFSTTTKAAPEASRIPLNIRISKINGQPAKKDIGVEGSIISIDPSESYLRKVVMEEFTGTWCGWCPRGMRAIDLLHEQYGERFIPIGVHVNDKMQDDSFYEVTKYNNGGFPSCALNRIVQCEPYYGTSFDLSPFYIVNDVENVMNSLTEATLKIDKVDLDASQNRISITTSSQFNINCDMEAYAMSYVITEDSVKDVQTNYFSIYKDHPKDVDEKLRDLTQKPEHWLTLFNHVGRFAYEPLGVAGSLPKNIQRNTSTTFTYEFELPKNIKNKKNLNVVALLLDIKTGEIVNASQLHISKANVTGITVPTSENWVEVIPCKGELTLKASEAQVKIYRPDGVLVNAEKIKKTTRISLPHGYYIVHVEQKGKVLVKKVRI